MRAVESSAIDARLLAQEAEDWHDARAYASKEPAFPTKMKPIDVDHEPRRLSRAEALSLCENAQPQRLVAAAARLRDLGHGAVVSYSRKVFIPLTRLCRDVCHYCTFATAPRNLPRAYMDLEEVLATARAGAAAGCKEALFTLGDRPERRYRAAREALDRLGHESTLSYLRAAASAVLEETGLLPHVNPGVMDAAEIARLREVSVSQGIMLESVSERLCEKGGPHHGSPDKRPTVRLETIRTAGELAVPFTSGILIGIGETRRERIESLLALRELHERYGHLQEIIVQNFRAKPGTRMANAPEPDLGELVWTIAAARLVLGPDMNIQAPPNLTPGSQRRLIAAGINDWGGVSPVTPDFVNPEAPWPQLEVLAQITAAAGKTLTERLAVYPRYALESERWLAPRVRAPVLRSIDAEGFARSDSWTPGGLLPYPIGPAGGGDKRNRGAVARESPAASVSRTQPCGRFDPGSLLDRARSGEGLSETEIARLFEVRGDEVAAVCDAADRLRREVNGDRVTYVVNRNINYTNVCYFRCGFCAFSKGRLSANLRGRPYDLDLDEIARRAREAWARGATEVCMQGGIHPDYTGRTYLNICRAVKDATPDMHLHAFSALEVWQGARSLGVGVARFLERLRDVGLGTLPGTAAEILDDEVRAIICPDKINTAQWLGVIEAAHRAGLRTTATIMFGHVDSPRHWARHLLRVRALQLQTGGITEFVPLPFVPMEAPLYLKGLARRGPTSREVVLMHAIARLALHPCITNIQASWVKLGPEGVRACLDAGVNDLGGTLMNESITRAAGGSHGEEMTPERMQVLIEAAGRIPHQRTTLYRSAPPSQIRASFGAAALGPSIDRSARRRERVPRAHDLIRSAVLPS